MVKIKGDGFYLSRSKWESEAVFSILNELLKAGYIESYTTSKDVEDDTLVVYVKKSKEESKNEDH